MCSVQDQGEILQMQDQQLDPSPLCTDISILPTIKVSKNYTVILWRAMYKLQEKTFMEYIVNIT